MDIEDLIDEFIIFYLAGICIHVLVTVVFVIKNEFIISDQFKVFLHFSFAHFLAFFRSGDHLYSALIYHWTTDPTS